jgi:hypothetical protein
MLLSVQNYSEKTFTSRHLLVARRVFRNGDGAWSQFAFHFSRLLALHIL